MQISLPERVRAATLPFVASCVGFAFWGEAQARGAQEGFVELLALRYTLNSTKVEDTRADGTKDSATLKNSRLSSFPGRVTFAGRFSDFSIQLSRALDAEGSGYLDFGYVLDPMFEFGLGVNLTHRDDQNLDQGGEKFEDKRRGYVVGPYALVVLPLEFCELEVRWEFDYGITKRVLKKGSESSQRADAKGFETDLDARFVFRVGQRVSLTTGVNVFYYSTTDKAPLATVPKSKNAERYAESKRTDLVLGLNLLGARFTF